MPIEFAIKRLTSQPADLLGIEDRGRLKTGMWADVVVFDPATIAPGKRDKLYDMPSGGKRIVVYCTGIDYTIVNGVPIYAGGELTGAIPGRILHS
jgi:N-acyl-D-amino-acid deacylase